MYKSHRLSVSVLFTLLPMLLVSTLDAAPAEKYLKIKGFYIGMPIDSAASLINTKYQEIFTKARVLESGKHGGPAFEILLDNLYNGDMAHSYCTIIADEDKKVILMYFPSQAVDALFNVKDLNYKNFKKIFRDAYDLEDLIWRDNAFVYTDLIRGLKIYIDKDKTLSIYKMTEQEACKFD